MIIKIINRTKFAGFFCCLVLGVVLIGARVSTDNGVSFSIDIAQLEDKNNIIPIAIIGSGPAGLMAAVYGARESVHTVVIEGGTPGGLLTETERVDNWPGGIGLLGADIVNDVKKQALYFGAHFLSDTIESVNFNQWPYVLHTEEGKTLHALTVIIATGATPRRLGVPGEQAYWGRGVSSCALCDAPFYKDEEVFVVGGGDSAVEEALALASVAKKVTILVRKGRMRTAVSMHKRLKGYSNIAIRYNTEVQKMLGDDTGITGVELFNNKTGKITTESIGGVFLAIGHLPNSTIFHDYIETDQVGYIKLVGRSQATRLPGVFAVGDVADPIYRQAGVAAGHGIKAAIEAVKFLRNIGCSQSLMQEVSTHFFVL